MAKSISFGFSFKGKLRKLTSNKISCFPGIKLSKEIKCSQFFYSYCVGVAYLHEMVLSIILAVPITLKVEGGGISVPFFPHFPSRGSSVSLPGAFDGFVIFNSAQHCCFISIISPSAKAIRIRRT